jgi:hypothetical protein
MANIDTSTGSFYVPYKAREGDRTPNLKTYYQAATQGGAADADHTLGAFLLSGTSDFIVDYIAVSFALMTSTAAYNVLVGGDTVASFRGANNSSRFEQLTFGPTGLRVADITSTGYVIQVVSSNAAATAGSKTLFAKGHYV